MRLRTLPVSLAGVICGTGCALLHDSFNAIVTLLCILFAALAQIASNFSNEYYDYKNGIDKKGREGFRRGVTEGEISPLAMKLATYATLCVATIIGLLLLFFGPWWLILVGITIMLFALGYTSRIGRYCCNNFLWNSSCHIHLFSTNWIFQPHLIIYIICYWITRCECTDSQQL